MLRKMIWVFAIAATGMMAFAGATNIQLKVGSVGVATHQLGQKSCIQIPIFINDSLAPRTIRDLTITLEITGDTAIIDGSITQGMIVANGFANVAATAITNPATDLADAGGATTPTSTLIFNSATQEADTHSFELGNMNGSWTLNNNLGGVGRKQGFVFNAGGASLGASSSTDQLVMVLEIPLVADPGPAVLDITAVSNATVTDGNSYTLSSGGLLQENFDLTFGMGSVVILDATRTGLYRPSSGSFFLDTDGSGTFSLASGDQRFQLGGPGDLPVVGDWNDDGRDEIGIFRPSNANWYLDANASGGFNAGDVRFPMGGASDTPIAGRWVGSPTIGDSVGIHRSGSSKFFLDVDGNYNINTAAGDIQFLMGAPTDIAIIGDWDGDGFDQLGLFRPSTPEFFLDMDADNTINIGAGDVRFPMGASTDIPMAGDWNNSGKYTVGLRRQSTFQFFLDLDGNNSINLATGDDRQTWGGGAGDFPVSGIW